MFNHQLFIHFSVIFLIKIDIIKNEHEEMRDDGVGVETNKDNKMKVMTTIAKQVRKLTNRINPRTSLSSS